MTITLALPRPRSACDARINLTTRFLWLLCDVSSNTGVAELSDRHVMEELNASEQAVIRARMSVKELGYFVIEPGLGRGHATTYRRIDEVLNPDAAKSHGTGDALAQLERLAEMRRAMIVPDAREILVYEKVVRDAMQMMATREEVDRILSDLFEIAPTANPDRFASELSAALFNPSRARYVYSAVVIEQAALSLVETQPEPTSEAMVQACHAAYKRLQSELGIYVNILRDPEKSVMLEVARDKFH